MNQYERANAGNLALVEPAYERTDARKRDIVNQAISVQESSNTVSALEYLKSHGISPHVIERVLLEPGRRRQPTLQ